MQKKKATKQKNKRQNQAETAAWQWLQDIQSRLQSLEEGLGGLQQEMQETLATIEARTENLEQVLAELQTELLQRKPMRSPNARMHHN